MSKYIGLEMVIIKGNVENKISALDKEEAGLIEEIEELMDSSSCSNVAIIILLSLSRQIIAAKTSKSSVVATKSGTEA